jgi:hypothetical protein
LAARLDVRGEEEREGRRERLRSSFIGRRSAVEREGEVHGRPQTNDAGRAATTISGGGAARVDGRAAWQGGERPAQFGEAAARTLGRHMAWFGVAQGGRCSAHGWRSGGEASHREKS